MFNYSCLHFLPPQPNLPPSPVSTLPLGVVHVSEGRFFNEQSKKPTGSSWDVGTVNLKPEKERSRCLLTVAMDRALGCTKHVPSIPIPCDRSQERPTGGVGVPTLGVRRQRFRKVWSWPGQWVSLSGRATLRKVRERVPVLATSQRGLLGGRRMADSCPGQDSEPKKSLCSYNCDLFQRVDQGREVNPESELNVLALSAFLQVVINHRHMALGGQPRYSLGVT